MLASNTTIAESCQKSTDLWLDLPIAIRTGDVAAFDCLIGQVSDINGADPADLWENRLLHYAARYNRQAFAALLIQRGAKPDLPNAADKTAARIAVDQGSTQTLAFLLDQGANLEAPDTEGRTLLFWAVAEDDPVTTKLLLDRGANPDAIFTSGERPASIRDYVQKRGKTDIINLFNSYRESKP